MTDEYPTLAGLERPIDFKVICAKGLAGDTGVLGAYYVVVSLENQFLFRTNTLPGDSPQWNKSHTLSASGSNTRPLSFAIAIHRENPSEPDTLIGEIKDFHIDLRSQDLTIPIKSLNRENPIQITARIEDPGTLSNQQVDRHHGRVICLQNLVVKSLSVGHPDLLDEARLVVKFVVEGMASAQTTAAVKHPQIYQWAFIGRILIPSDKPFKLEVIRANEDRQPLGFVQPVCQLWADQEHVTLDVVRHADDGPHLQLLFLVVALPSNPAASEASQNRTVLDPSSHDATSFRVVNPARHLGDLIQPLKSNQSSSSNTSPSLNKSIFDRYLNTAISPNTLSTAPAGDLDALSSQFIARFLSRNGPLGIGRVLSTSRDTVQSEPDLYVSGTQSLHRFLALGNPSDLDNAIMALGQSASSIVGDDRKKALCFNHLGSSLLQRYELNRDVSNIEQAVSAQQNALRLIPDGHPNKGAYFSTLGKALFCRFEHLEDMSDLETAISAQKTAEHLTPTGHPSKTMRLNDLGISLQRRYEMFGEASDLETAISIRERAVHCTPIGHPGKAGHLSNLGISLHHRFELLGEKSDLEKAISFKEEAVQLIQTGHSNKAVFLSNLANSYMCSYEHFAEVFDLEKAISVLEDAVELTPIGHLSMAGRLSNLGSSYQCRYEHFDELSDLESAISAQEKAVELTPSDNHNKAMYLNNLGNSFKLRYDKLQEIADLEKAISAQEMAVKLTPTGQPAKAKYLNNLGCSLMQHSQQLEKVAILRRAISLQENAVQSSLISDPNRAMYLYNLCTSYLCLFLWHEDLLDFKKGIHYWSQAAQSPTSPPHICFQFACHWARLTQEAGVPSIDAYTCALNLLPHAAWLGLTIRDRHRFLSEIGNIVHDAAAHAITSGDPELALEWLEQGRAIVWGQLLQLRHPVDELLAKEPKLGTRLLKVAKDLEAISARESPNGNMTFGQMTRKHHQLALEWDNLVKQARKIPSFEGFLGRKKISQLAGAAQTGPVIVLTVQERGDALVLMGSTVIHIPLPNFTLKRACDMQLALKRLQRSRYRFREAVFERDIEAPQASSGFEEILRDLWSLIVKPILDCLAISVPSDSNFPRIWWCPTGPLAFLPIHAAGLYNTEERGHKLSDYAVSSYIPTITALLNIQYKLPSPAFKMFAIAQASTPGQLPLPQTETELDNLKKHTSQLHVESLKGNQVTVERVAQGMLESSWVHLACHGSQNPSDPTKSALLLADGNLELARITKMSLPHAEFAFLSACQTATGDVKLEDETVHLAAGMLMAGYRSVIATMWAIRDKDGPLVADDVYGELFRNGQPDHTRAAYALHHATQNLRLGGAPFLAWVPFIHIGR